MEKQKDAIDLLEEELNKSIDLDINIEDFNEDFKELDVVMDQLSKDLESLELLEPSDIIDPIEL